jgi:integrase
MRNNGLTNFPAKLVPNLQLIADHLRHPASRLYLQAALAENTRRAYQADLAHFRKWGGTVPSNSEEVALYLANFGGKLAAATLSRRLVSIGKAHTTQGFSTPCTSAVVKATLRGIRRIHGTTQKQATPAIKEDLMEMVAGLSGLKGIRDRALLLVGFAGAFRRSELAGLNIEDLEFNSQGLIVYLRRSKTDQEGVGRKVGIPHARGTVCPVAALRTWLDTAKIDSGRIFRPISRHAQIVGNTLSPHAVSLVVKERAKAAGLDPAKYSGHSLRAGLVTSAAKAGVSSWKIRQQTGHKSDAMLIRYIRDSQIFVDNAAGAVL